LQEYRGENTIKSFAEQIVELKILADRWCEGKNKTNGLFLAKYQVLYVLSEGDFVAPKIIINKLGLAKSNLAIIAKELIKDGLIESKKDNQNRREIYYCITQKGRSELTKKLEQIEDQANNKQKKQIKTLEDAIKILEDF